MNVRRGKRLRELRKQAGMSMGDLADLLEVPVIVVSDVERGMYSPDNIPKLAGLLHCDVDELYAIDCDDDQPSAKSVDRADMIFACLAEDIEAARVAQRGARGMTVRCFGELECASFDVLRYLDRIVKRWNEGDGT